MATYSIITIVHNDVLHIEETMNSVTRQSYKEIEYILIDGDSKDGTKEVIRNYLQTHAQIIHQESGDGKIYIEATHSQHPTLTFKFLSQKDKGIYDAMNKGIALATKEWINFMNCGDWFYNSNVLESVRKINKKDYDLIIGNTEVIYGDQNLSIVKTAPQNAEKSLKRFGANIIHQSIFFKTQIHQQYLYNTQDYKLASDYELIYKLFDQQFSFCFIPVIVSSFHTGGSSDVYGVLRTNESFVIAKKYGKFFPYTCFYYLFALSKKLAKLYMPSALLKKILASQK